MPSPFPVNATFTFTSQDLSAVVSTDPETGKVTYGETTETFTASVEAKSSNSNSRPNGVPIDAIKIEGTVVSSSNTPDTLLPASLKLPDFGTAVINGNSGKVYITRSIGSAIREIDFAVGEEFSGWFYV